MEPTAVESQLIALAQDQAENQARVANELEQLNERMAVVEEQARAQTAALQQLVALETRRDAREQGDLEVRKERWGALRGLLTPELVRPLLWWALGLGGLGGGAAWWWTDRSGQ